MTFVNEFASVQDVQKYNLKDVFYKVGKGFVPQYSWTVDHERGIYLSFIRMGREEETGIWTFFIYWKDQVLVFHMRVNGRGEYKGPCWRNYSNLQLSLPIELEEQRDQIVEDIKKGLIAFQDFGMYTSSTTTVDVTFAF